MTRRIHQTMEDGRTRKRVLKPVVEKKRRDRINQSLAELRLLLLNHTSDPRLQNPKIEKAEILDLAVEHLQRNFSKVVSDSTNSHMKTQPPVVNLHHSESNVPTHATMETAGFQQCVSQLSSYMTRITPSQRANLIEGLKHHSSGKQRTNNKSKPEFCERTSETSTTKGPHHQHHHHHNATSVDAICTSEPRSQDSPVLTFASLSPFQPHSCSTPHHDYLSPPPSPWLSPSFSSYAPSPPFPSFTSHFSFPPSLSPTYSNTSFFSFSPTHSGPPGLHYPPFTTLWSPPHLSPREGSPPNTSTPMWRPWF